MPGLNAADLPSREQVFDIDPGIFFSLNRYFSF